MHSFQKVFWWCLAIFRKNITSLTIHLKKNWTLHSVHWGESLLTKFLAGKWRSGVLFLLVYLNVTKHICDFFTWFFLARKIALKGYENKMRFCEPKLLDLKFQKNVFCDSYTQKQKKTWLFLQTISLIMTYPTVRCSVFIKIYRQWRNSFPEKWFSVFYCT